MFLTVASKWPLRIPQEHHERTWALTSSHECSWALMSAHLYSWVFMGAHDSSLGILSGHLHAKILNKKCELLKWLPSIILPISRSSFHQIIKTRASRTIGARGINILRVFQSCAILSNLVQSHQILSNFVQFCSVFSYLILTFLKISFN